MLAEKRFYYVSLIGLLAIPLVVTLLAFLSLANSDASELAIATLTPPPTLPPDPNVLADAGMDAFAAGDFDAAAWMLTEALVLVPDSAELHNALGIALTETDQPSDAISAFDAALQLDPTFAEAQFNRARAQHKLSNWQAAEADYVAAIKLETQAIYYHELGNLYLDLNDVVSAETAYLQALRFDPNFTDSYLNLSTLYGNLGEIEAAIANLQRVLLLDPNHLNARANLATLYEHQGETALAQSQWQTIIALAPNSDLAERAAEALAMLKDS